MSTQNSSPPTEDIPDDTAQIGEEFAVVLSTLTGFRQQITMLQNLRAYLVAAGISK